MRYVMFCLCAALCLMAACFRSPPQGQAVEDASQTTTETPKLPGTIEVVPVPGPSKDVPKKTTDTTTDTVSDATKDKCPAEMVEVMGAYCTKLKETCLEWMAPDDHFRCKRFAKATCEGPTVAKHYCMDRYEYPNKKGTTPKVLKLWPEAQAACKEQGKRLCTAEEWTFACQGPQWKPYPYGYERDSTACRIDLGLQTPSWAAGRALGYETTPAPLKGQASVNFSKPSGEYPRCVSDFGVYDMTGNVDEWVDQGGQSWLKGGWWGNVRNRCGPEAVTTGHDKTYGGIQVGFRCCSDAKK